MPSEHSLLVRGNESAPLGNQTVFLQIAVSKNKNFDPSARKDAISDGSSRPGQKRKAGRGLTTNNHAVTVATMLLIPDMYAIVSATFHVRSSSIKSSLKVSLYALHPLKKAAWYLFVSS